MQITVDNLEYYTYFVEHGSWWTETYSGDSDFCLKFSGEKIIDGAHYDGLDCYFTNIKQNTADFNIHIVNGSITGTDYQTTVGYPIRLYFYLCPDSDSKNDIYIGEAYFERKSEWVGPGDFDYRFYWSNIDNTTITKTINISQTTLPLSSIKIKYLLGYKDTEIPASAIENAFYSRYLYQPSTVTLTEDTTVLNVPWMQDNTNFSLYINGQKQNISFERNLQQQNLKIYNLKPDIEYVLEVDYYDGNTNLIAFKISGGVITYVNMDGIYTRGTLYVKNDNNVYVKAKSFTEV